MLIYLASEKNSVDEGKVQINKVARNNLRVKLADLVHVSPARYRSGSTSFRSTTLWRVSVTAPSRFTSTLTFSRRTGLCAQERHLQGARRYAWRGVRGRQDRLHRVLYCGARYHGACVEDLSLPLVLTIAQVDHLIRRSGTASPGADSSRTAGRSAPYLATSPRPSKIQQQRQASG